MQSTHDFARLQQMVSSAPRAPVPPLRRSRLQVCVVLAVVTLILCAFTSRHINVSTVLRPHAPRSGRNLMFRRIHQWTKMFCSLGSLKRESKKKTSSINHTSLMTDISNIDRFHNLSRLNFLWETSSRLETR